MSGGVATLSDQSITSRKIDLTCARTHIATQQTTTSTSAADLATTAWYHSGSVTFLWCIQF